MLLPNPPNDILPTPIAKSAPRMTIHAGRFDGRLNANKTPVRMAEPSVMVGSRLKRYFSMRNSNSTHEATEISVTISAPKPKQ